MNKKNKFLLNGSLCQAEASEDIHVFFNRPGQSIDIDAMLEDISYAHYRLAFASAWFTYTPIAEAFMHSSAIHKACFLNRADLKRAGSKAWQTLQQYFNEDYYSPDAYTARRSEGYELIGWEGMHLLGSDQWQEGVMHHKFLVVDDRVVWCGSFNFTYQALQNFEVLLRIPRRSVCNAFWDEVTRLAYIAQRGQ